MPILPNTLERMLFFQLNQAPGPVVDIFSAVAFRIVLAAVRLNVFDALQNGSSSLEEIANRTGTDREALSRLLDALEAFGYVRKQGSHYTNTPMASKWMARSSSTSVAAGFEYWGELLDQLWGNLEGSLRSGRSPVNLYQWIEHQPETSEAFQRWMVATARIAAEEVLGKLKLPAGAGRLLDVGGGHGMYSILLCQRYPALSATIFDSPQALKTARANIQAEKMEGRVQVQEGDFLRDDLGSGYDIALVFNIVHGFSKEQNRELLRKAAGALNPGGMVVVLEQVAGQAPGPTSRAAVQVLEMSYFHLLGGQVYRYEEIAGWLKTAGFTELRRKNLLRVPGNCLIIGKR